MAAVSPVIDTDCDLEQLKPSSTSDRLRGQQWCERMFVCGGGVSLGDRETKSLLGNIRTGVWQDVAGVRECTHVRLQ